MDYRLPSDSAGFDGYVAKLSTAGALLWATPLGGGRVRSLDVDASGHIVASGYFRGVLSPGFGLPVVTSTPSATGEATDDYFVAELGASGAVSWVVTFGGPGHEWNSSLAVDSSGSIHLAGYYSGAVDFDPDPVGTHELLNVSQTDMFLLRLRRS